MTRVVAERTTGYLSMRFCGLPARAAHGVIYRLNLVRGIVFMFVLHDGLTSKYGKPFLMCCARRLTLKKSISTERLFVHINMLPAHRKKGEQALGRSRGGLTTKIHACVEGLGQLANFILTGGQVNDVTQAKALIEEIMPGSVSADKAYDSDDLLSYIADKGAQAVIPPRANRKEQREYDRDHYRNRNIIERFFAKLKQFRRVATRYDKLASRFKSFVEIAASMIWLK